MPTATFEEIWEAIRLKKARWIPAGISGPIPKYALGVREDAVAEDLKRVEFLPRPNVNKLVAEFRALWGQPVAPNPKLPRIVDWRNHRGVNAVTPVKDQAQCGACVAFGTVAVLESMTLREWGLATDLSEADLFFCGFNAGSCADGWTPGMAFWQIDERGVALENCFPYPRPAQQVACIPCRDRESLQIKAKGRVASFTAAARKKYLDEIGPAGARIWVFEDFMAYSSGVYSHVTGDLEGTHFLEVIGFNDLEGCWICKNSWGTGWGENGFGKIAYGDVSIDMEIVGYRNPLWLLSSVRLGSRLRMSFLLRPLIEETDDVLAWNNVSRELECGRFFHGTWSWSSVGTIPGSVRETSRSVWVENFTGTDSRNVMVYVPSEDDWWYGKLSSGRLKWNRIGETSDFGKLDAKLIWMGRFTSATAAEFLLYVPSTHEWHLGSLMSRLEPPGWFLGWRSMGNTAWLGNLSEGRHFWAGSFTDSKVDEVLFYYPKDHNWWRGRWRGDRFRWNKVGDSRKLGTLDANLIWKGKFSGKATTELIAYAASTHEWHLGSLAPKPHGQGWLLRWTSVGNTAWLGDLADGRPFWIGRFTGTESDQVLFYYPKDHNWWLGSINQNRLKWKLVGNSAHFGNLMDERLLWVGSMKRSDKSNMVLHYPRDQNWWLGTVGVGTKLHWTPFNNTFGRWSFS